MTAVLANSGLPSFWRHSPKQWFTHVDAVFRIGQVQSDVSRVNFVLAALDEDGIRSVADLLGEDVAYDTLRARLIYTYTMSLAKRIQSIIDPGDLGDRTPSQLLRDMRHICPDDMGNASLGYFWLQKLPKSLRPVIAGLSGSLNDIAERADRVMEASLSAKLADDEASQCSLGAVFPPLDVLDALGPRTTDECEVGTEVSQCAQERRQFEILPVTAAVTAKAK